jgi:uncharacterized membrane protein
MGKAGSESHTRSILKAVSWRFFAVMVTVGVAWVITGEAKFAAAVGIADSGLKIVLYYFHERIWNYIGLSRLKLG